MSFTIGKSNDFNVEEGSYLGRLVTLIDMGVQNRGTYKGEKLADAPLIGMEFEIVKEDGSRAKLFKEVLKSGHEQSSMFSIATALHGGGSKAAAALANGIKADALIGLPAVIEVGTTAGGNSKVAGITSVLKGTVVPEAESELVVAKASDLDETTLSKLPKFVQDKLGIKLDKEDDEVDF